MRIEFVYSWITLSNFCEIPESKLSYCSSFYLQGSHIVSFYTSSSINHLYLTPRSVKLYTIFLNLDSILAPNPNGGLKALSHTLQLLEPLPKSSWITSEKIIRTLCNLIYANISVIHSVTSRRKIELIYIFFFFFPLLFNFIR